MRYDPQNALDVTRRTDAPTNHKGCVMTAPILVTGDTGRLGSRVGRHRWAEGARDGPAARGVPTGKWQVPSERPCRGTGLACRPPDLGGFSWPRRATDPVRQSGWQGMAADSHDTFVHRSHSSVATCHSCDKQTIPTGASTHRHAPELLMSAQVPKLGARAPTYAAWVRVSLV
jgi:hypothetical protein